MPAGDGVRPKLPGLRRADDPYLSRGRRHEERDAFTERTPVVPTPAARRVRPSCGRRECAMLIRVLVVAAGGALGTAARYLISGWVARLAQSSFPFGILLINVSGALVLGGVMGATASGRFLLSPTTRSFLTIGILGGYTTFSTFSYETVEALRAGDLRVAVGNLAATLGLGLAACWLGLKLGERL